MRVEGFIEVSQILRSGVYALVHRGVVVYIGKSKGMLTRIYTHRSMWGKAKPSWLSVRGILFDEVFVRPCTLDVIDELEREMIAIYRPKFNTKLKPPGATDRPLSLKVGNVVLPLAPKPTVIERRI